MPFADRTDAGQRLAAALSKYKAEQPIIFALPRGGVPVAAEVAASLKAPLDLILVRKIGVPYQPELAMGAVVDGPKPIVVRNVSVIQQANVSETEFQAACQRELVEIERRRQRYLGDRPHPELFSRTAIIVDDGIATGATTRAALQAVRARSPKRLVLGVPVAPTSTLDELRSDADEVICLEDYEPFGAIGFFYSDFRQISDEEVIATLARFPAEASASAAQ